MAFGETTRRDAMDDDEGGNGTGVRPVRREETRPAGPGIVGVLVSTLEPESVCELVSVLRGASVFGTGSARGGETVLAVAGGLVRSDVARRDDEASSFAGTGGDGGERDGGVTVDGNSGGAVEEADADAAGSSVEFLSTDRSGPPSDSCDTNLAGVLAGDEPFSGNSTRGPPPDLGDSARYSDAVERLADWNFRSSCGVPSVDCGVLGLRQLGAAPVTILGES